jgi:hypothetical protein
VVTIARTAQVRSFMQKDDVFRCLFGGHVLSVRFGKEPGTLNIRVTKRAKDVFAQGLVIPSNTVLQLQPVRPRKNNDTHLVTVRVFVPKIQYGRMVASGTATVDASFFNEGV